MAWCAGVSCAGHLTMLTPQTIAIRIALCVLLVLTLLGGGFYAGMRFQQGREALREKTDLVATAEAYRKQLQDAAQDFRTAADRMARISEDYQAAQADGESFYADLRTQWQQYWRSRPDLAGCALDADGLRLWNDANRGSFADPAAADPGRPASTVPAAAAGEGRKPSGAGGEPRPGDEALRQLHRAPQAPGRRGS